MGHANAAVTLEIERVWFDRLTLHQLGRPTKMLDVAKAKKDGIIKDVWLDTHARMFHFRSGKGGRIISIPIERVTEVQNREVLTEAKKR